MEEEAAAKVVESPQVEAPQPEQTVEEEPKTDVEALISKLEAIGVEKPEQIEGMYTASQQSGNMANLLGAERQRVKELEERLAAVESASKQQPHDDYGYEQPAVNIEEVVGRAFEKKYMELTKAQQEAQAAYQREVATIQGDPEYATLKDGFTEIVSNPQHQMALQTGQTSLTKLYSDFKSNYYKKLALELGTALKEKVGKVSAKVTPPHVEQGDTGTGTVSEANTVGEQLHNIKQQATGTDQDLEAMLAAVIPDSDPIFANQDTYTISKKK